MSLGFVSFGQKKKKKKNDDDDDYYVDFQWKQRLVIERAKLSICRKSTPLKSLNFAANLGLNARLNREEIVSQNAGAFKKWKTLMGTL